MTINLQKDIEEIVFRVFYGGPLAGSKERLAKALITELGLQEQEPIGWVRSDKAVTWWGSDYPVHWEKGEGLPIYGMPMMHSIKHG